MLHHPTTSQLEGGACLAEPLPGDLLESAGAISGSHALVIATNGLDLMCSLLRQGCSAAMILRLNDRPECQAYDLVLAPQVTSTLQVGRLAYQAKRAVVPAGRFLAHVPHSAGGPDDDVGGLLARTLRLVGFATVRAKLVSGGLIVRADLGMPTWSSVFRMKA